MNHTLLCHFTTLLLITTAALHAEVPTKKLAPVLQPYVDSRTLAGAVVLVADPDKVLDVEAVGFEDVAAKKPMQTNSMFWIASQSKPITAAALMILVDEGKVSVDDPVEKYLPEFKGQRVNLSSDPKKPELVAPRHPITVREVLSHTSGLDFKSPMEAPTLDLKPLAERVSSYAKMALLFQPGSKSKYSNAGINTAGRIIEVVSGMKYETFLAERLFKPLGMNDTTFWPNQEQQARLAKSYKPNAAKDGLEELPVGQLLYPLDSRERFPMPAGGLFSTANDLSLFYRMMANGGTLQRRAHPLRKSRAGRDQRSIRRSQIKLWLRLRHRWQILHARRRLRHELTLRPREQTRHGLPRATRRLVRRRQKHPAYLPKSRDSCLWPQRQRKRTHSQYRH
jgi:CubicO group peptidase (beta-lactamase class C family)